MNNEPLLPVPRTRGRGPRLLVLLALSCVLIGMLLGFAAERSPAGKRAADLTSPVDARWYTDLPRDPALATQAFLARVPQAMRERGEAVSDSRYLALVARVVVNLAGLLLFLHAGGAAALAQAMQRRVRYRWVQAACVLAGAMVFQWSISLPVEVIAGYFRWRHFGFVDRPFMDWLNDTLLSWAPLTGVCVFGLLAVRSCIRLAPRTWPIWASCVYLTLATAYVTATPSLIEPLVNTISPLPEGPVKQQILALAQQAGVQVTDVFTSDGSRQGRILNAHVSGVAGTARITVDDTTLEHAYLPAILAVVAHEIGHYQMHHVLKGVLFASGVALAGFGLMAWLGPMLIRRFGVRWEAENMSSVAAVVVLWLMFSAWGFFAEPLNNLYTRIQETQADDYALALSQAPEGLAEFMIHDADIARLQPTEMDVLLFYDHPGSAERVKHAMQWRAEAKSR